MDLRHYLNNNKFNNKLSHTLIDEAEIDNLETENHLHGVKKSRKSAAARRRKKQKKIMMENKSITLSLIDEYKKRDEAEEIDLSRVSTLISSRSNDITLNSSMDYFPEEFTVDNQETSDSNIQVTCEVDPFRMSEYCELDDNTFNPSIDYLCDEFAVSDQKISGPNIRIISEASLSRMSKYPELDDNTFNTSMDYLRKEPEVNNQKISSPNIRIISEASSSRMSKYPELDDNTFNTSMDHLYKEPEVNNQKTSSSNAQAASEAGLFRMSKSPGLGNNTFNSSMDHLCKESEVNNKKTSSSNAQATSKTGLFRMSKSPGLDNNTFNSFMDHLYKESEINNQITSSSNTQATSEAGPSRVSKCSRLGNTLNLSMDRLCKESEGNETSNSNAAITSDFFKMAIVPMEYPERKLNSNEVSVVRRLVLEHILSMSKKADAKFPRFHSNTERNGLIIFNCASKETCEWLSNLTPKLTLDDGVQLRIVDIDKLSKYHRAIIYVDDSTITKDLLYFLEKQNEGLITNDWIFFPGSRDAKNRSIVYFGDTSLEILKALEFKPFCGLERAVIKLTKENKKKVNEEAGNKNAFSLNK